MIQLLASRYRKHIAYSFLLIFYIVTALPVYGMRSRLDIPQHNFSRSYAFNKNRIPVRETSPLKKSHFNKEAAAPVKSITTGDKKKTGAYKVDKADIGGPTQPEMSRFKSAGADNLVNLFTGDFSYNIPLMDVGGYPVNIFYDGGITPEQDASWVGLGWNINPGTVSRNMRGVPDDFNGTDMLTQTQKMKPNVTWGFTGAFDLELAGIKGLPNNIASLSVGQSLDLSFNNYLGPALGIGIKGGISIKVAELGGSEKSTGSVNIGGGIAANINSRSGLTLSPSLSLTANAFKNEKGASFGGGLRLGTSYNSRSGIKQLQLSEQVSYNYQTAKENKDGTKKTNSESMGATSTSSISFSKPSYIPTIRMPLSNEAFSGHFQLGSGLFGIYGSGEIEAYKQVSRVVQSYQEKPLVGYLYYQNAVNDPNAVMDFTRFNDNEITPNTPIISAPQYSYDVFSIQGEGTGGTIRAYRDDLGYVRDNITRSQDKSISGGVDIGIPGHYGANFNIIKTPTVISEWKRGNKLRNTTGFTPSNKLEESVYFRNPGETSVLNSNQFSRIGGTDLVRFKLEGTNAAPTIEPYLEHFSKTTNTVTGVATDIRTIPAYERKKRTQVTSFLRADEASVIGLDEKIKNYKSSVLNAANNLDFDPIDRVSEYRKAHHISQINVTEASGRRYVYGLPVYNITQKDFTFSIDNNPTAEDQVEFNPGYATAESSLLNDKTKDGFVQITETPAYAHSFLLTGLLSTDYVDVTGNGISEDDLGDAVKFNYTRQSNDHEWRTPLSTQGNMANFNDGNRSESKDDKGIVSYGKRESWYLHSIESKTMIALFTVEDRKDGKGVSGEQDAVNTNDNSQKRLQKIELFSKSDVKKNGLGTNGAKPIKTVRFTYSYRLCANTVNNNGEDETVDGVTVDNAGGKLTLDGIYFTFNGKNRANKNKYVFSYTNSDNTGNPVYSPNASDRWGNYKPANDNPPLDANQPDGPKLKNSDYPYSVQDKAKADPNAGAWSLKKILLPSGGQIEVEYESDDYAFVQNRRAAAMMRIAGLGKDQTGFGSKLYENGGADNFYVFIEVPDANVDIKKTYLEGLEQLAFKLAVNMPKGLEYINCYASIDGDNYGKVTDNNTTIWIKLKPARDGVSPLSLSVLDYLRERLPGQAFRGYDVSESTGLKQIADILGGMGDALKSAFKDPINFLRSQRKAQSIIPARSFVRLNDHDGYKYGGGQRVKSVVLKDNWKKMTEQYTSTYGQQYDYKTTEIFNGVERTISSGVASYEPSIGSEENPFQSIVEVSTKLPLGPASYGAIEMPMLDAFFPAPVVGYSKVTVRSIQKGTIPAGKKSRSGIGKQVTEFYTAKDFPVYYNHTPFDPSSDKTYHDASVLNFFYKYAIDTRALSQGFIVETNDMHGKLKSQASYAEGDEKTRINYTENFYRNTGSNGLNEKFDFIYASKGGEIEEGNMGIDVELMTDTREFSVKSASYEVQGQVDLFPIFAGLPWLPFLWQVSGNSENTYRAVTTTKAISYHGILDRVVAIDKGSMVTTKNLVYDAETGDVVVNETQNEFDKPVYTVNYPAYWAYSGMGLAYKNIDAVYSGVTFTDGKITGGLTIEQSKNVFESGDELYIIDPGPESTYIPSSTINGTVTLTCSDQGCTQQGATGITFGFPTPTPAPLTIQVGHIANYPNEDKATGYDIFTLPSGVVPNTYYNPYQNQTFNFSIPQGTTSISFPEPIYLPGLVGTNRPWICQSCQTPVTSLYIKGFSTNNQFITNFSTSQNYTVNNVAVNTNPSCELPYSDPNEKLIWAFNNNKDAGPLTDANPDFIFIDKTGKPYSRSGVKFRIVRSGKRNMLSSAVAGLTMMTYPVIGEGSNRKLVANNDFINTNRKVINASAVKYKEKWQTDNDVFYKYITVTDPVTCETTEVEDCSGYLEKKINSYRKGLLGNFRVHHSRVFYGDRVETDPTIATNLPHNGFLNEFNLYWNFNNYNNLVPLDDSPDSKWVWNSEVTKVNSKGLELETKDALGIFTSALYGYNKTLPVSITNNAQNLETVSESFEDNNFNESMNNSIPNLCGIKHFDMSALPNCSIISTDNLNFSAHSGRHVLSLNANSTLDKIIPVRENTVDDFSLVYNQDNLVRLYEQGGNLEVISGNCGVANCEQTISYPNGMNFHVVRSPLEEAISYGNDFDYKITQYFEFSESGNYIFKIGTTGDNLYNTSDPFSFKITAVASQAEVPYTILAHSTSYPANWEDQIKLCVSKGIYKFEYLCHGEQQVCLTEGYCPQTSVNRTFYLNAQNISLTSYKSLSTQNGCSYTRPISANESMFNSTFTLRPTKKMVFSAWVRESNTQVSTYNNNEVQIDFGIGNANNVQIKPAGPIIEGWQRYEGYFIAPTDATSMNLKLVNNSGSMIYFDDIRIHPFNANMTSYVYDPVNLRLTAQLDANNYASFYEYDEEGTLIRTKAETKQGVKTITETRSFKQTTINQIQP